MKYTEEQIKEFAHNEFPDVGTFHPLCRREGFIVGFKKAMELLQPPAIKPLSDITDEDAVEVIRIFKGSSIGNLKFRDKINPWNERFRQFYYESDSEPKVEHIVANFSDNGIHALRSDRDSCYLFAFDFLRSKGYILPTKNV